MTITFRNNIQVTLWEGEIVGQLSGGAFENDDPAYHWEPWVYADVAVGDDVGRDFGVYKDDYDLVELVFLIGPRMISYVKDTLDKTISMDRLMNELSDMEEIMQIGPKLLPWWDEEDE